MLGNGNLNVSVDVAALGGPVSNGEGGIFTLLVDSVSQDSVALGGILAAPATLYGTLNASLPVVAGMHEIRISMTRPFTSNPPTTPTQYIDNVIISGSAISIPEPSAFAILGLLSLGMMGRRRRRR